MKKNIILEDNKVNGERQQKILYELNKEESSLYKSMGKAIGADVFHCLYLGNKNKKDFWEDVCGYRIIKDDQEANTMGKESNQTLQAIEFYKQKLKEKLTEDEIKFLWYFHVTEQLKEKLTRDEIDQINEYIRKRGEDDMWNIKYND